MNYLRYSSDEMFSSTELIRKGKTIFDKLNKREIEKAVILRDGKPSFMLLDFATYERVMKEYEKLNYKAGKKTQEQYLSLDDIEVSNNTKNVKTVKPISEPIIEMEEIGEIEDIEEIKAIDEIETPVQESKIEDITQIEQMSSDEINDEDLLKALEEIDKINISDNITSETSLNDEIDDFESEFDDDFKVALDEIKEEEEKVKEPPLKEFWDN